MKFLQILKQLYINLINNYVTLSQADKIEVSKNEVTSNNVTTNNTSDLMNISTKGLIELANYEGLSNTIYLDSGGVRTVGIGLTKSDIHDIDSWSWTKTITDKEAVNMFRTSLLMYIHAVNRALKVPVTQCQFDALVSITYNIGIGAMSRSTFIKCVNAKAASSTVTAAMKLFKYDNGKIIQGLVNRREAESKVFSDCGYNNNGTVARIAVDKITHKPRYISRVDIAQYL